MGANGFKKIELADGSLFLYNRGFKTLTADVQEQVTQIVDGTKTERNGAAL